MKIIRCAKDGRESSLNFVDKNNVLVGYVFETQSKPREPTENGEQHEVTFQLEHTDPPSPLTRTAWLTLVNVHNGYYSHGFYMQDPKGKRIREGAI